MPSETSSKCRVHMKYSYMYIGRARVYNLSPNWKIIELSMTYPNTTQIHTCNWVNKMLNNYNSNHTVTDTRIKYACINCAIWTRLSLYCLKAMDSLLSKYIIHALLKESSVECFHLQKKEFISRKHLPVE